MQGLQIFDNTGGYILYDGDGINYFDKNGVQYAQIRRTIIGTAPHGKHVKFKSPWDKPPMVLCSPTNTQISQSTYNKADLKLVCKAVNVSESGFDVQCFTTLMNAESSTGNQTIGATEKGNTASVSIDSKSTSISIPITVSYTASKSTGVFAGYSKNNYGQWVKDGSTTRSQVYFYNVSVTVVLSVNGTEKTRWTSNSISSQRGTVSSTGSTTLNATFNAGSKVTVTAYLNWRRSPNPSTGNNYSKWEYQSGATFPSGSATFSSTFSIDKETVISTGDVFFLAIDSNSNEYTVT